MCGCVLSPFFERFGWKLSGTRVLIPWKPTWKRLDEIESAKT
jgi:hypothetical protein